MKEKNRGNSVSTRSKQQLELALLMLMERDDFQAITIQEIAYHAGVARRTFYRNFSSKEDILEKCFCRIWEEYRDRIIRAVDLSIPNIARIFFSCMENHREFLSTVNNQHMLPHFLTRVDELLPSAFYAARGRNIPLADETVRYALAFSAGGFMRILILWLNDGARKSPDEMSAMVEGFFLIGQSK